MANPVPLDILDDIRDALALISKSSGYNFTVGQVALYQPKDIDLEAVAMPYAFVRPISDVIDAQDDDFLLAGGQTLSLWKMEVGVGMGAEDPTPGTDADWATSAAAKMRHDILAAVMTDPGRDGLAEWCLPTRTVWFPKHFQGFDSSVEVFFEIQYRHRVGDSTQQN